MLKADEDNSLSVIDLGCGTGNWLSVYKKYGCNVTGVDGGNIPQDMLMIDKTEFISTLTELSDIVLFSAAIPYQRGKEHINEQYHSYWIKKF